MTSQPDELKALETTAQRPACMEVWGGNEATYSSFAKAGIDIWLYSRPCDNDARGGDVYYLSSCASGRITRMMLADVAGHGDGVADLAHDLRLLMRQHINAINPRRLFEDVNKQFTKISAADRFATSIISSYFMTTGTLSVCSAGHPDPLIRRADGSAWEMLEIDEDRNNMFGDVPLGLDEVSAYTQTDVRVQPGDMLFCFTDGIIESTTAKGDMLGVEGLIALFNHLSADQPSTLIPALVSHIQQSDANFVESDDATMLLCRISDRSVPFSDNLAAPLRWAKNLLRTDQ